MKKVVQYESLNKIHGDDMYFSFNRTYTDIISTESA